MCPHIQNKMLYAYQLDKSFPRPYKSKYKQFYETRNTVEDL